MQFRYESKVALPHEQLRKFISRTKGKGMRNKQCSIGYLMRLLIFQQRGESSASSPLAKVFSVELGGMVFCVLKTVGCFNRVGLGQGQATIRFFDDPVWRISGKFSLAYARIVKD